mgnify:CR=1 FL=1|jgi:hypothetical protein
MNKEKNLGCIICLALFAAALVALVSEVTA